MGPVREHDKTGNKVQRSAGRSEVSESDADLANEALCALNHILDEGHTSQEVDVTIQGHPKVVTLPRGLGEVLRQILANTAAGRGVTVMPTHAELTTQQAAEMLNVSRPYLIKLLENGAIQFHKVGTHRRILVSSLRDYRRKMELDARTAADELAELTEELGLY